MSEATAAEVQPQAEEMRQGALSLDCDFKVMNKELEVPLTEQESNELGKSLAGHVRELGRLEREFSAVKKDWGARISQVEEQVASVSSTINAEKEKRIVECRAELDYAAGEVRYRYPANDEGTVLESRTMTAEERQERFAFADNVHAIRRTPDEILDAEVTEVEKPEAHEETLPVQTQQEEVRDIIREETNPHTKQSAVDGQPQE